MKYASMLLALPYEASYAYAIPDKLSEEAVPGKRAIVPFGRRKMTGFIVSVSDVRPEGDFELKEIERLIDKDPVFTEELVSLARWMAAMYFSSSGLCLSAMIPSGRRESEQSPFYEPSSFSPVEVLSKGQEHALSVLREEKSRMYYIFGITGSGKSEVYLRRAEDIIRKGKQVLYLVPEITLSEQLSDEVYSRFSGRVAILHSELTPSQRLKSWHEIMRGDVDLVIGARSSVFAPFRSLGLIILDEEHETSYKAGNAPRYHARQVAQYRAAECGAEFIMGSATPSLEAWRLMKEQRITRIDMPERVGAGHYPRIRVINTIREKRNISAELEEEIRKALRDKRGVILFLNRRGYTYGYVCNTCGTPVTCPNCSVSLTYHKKENRLFCHTCGYSAPLVTECPECGSVDLSPHGYGTENIEEEAAALFPSAVISRLDSDTKGKSRGEMQRILHDFRDGKIDILLGTQMIAKGLNFPTVSLVGVLNADSSLSVPDFRAAERTFDLLHQVAGRAGRYSDDGIVLIQTHQPLAPAIRYAAENDIASFIRSEMDMRRKTGFPPYSRLINIAIRGKNEDRTAEEADKIDAIACELESSFPDVEIFSASPCLVEKRSGYYRYHVLLRSESMQQLLVFASRLFSSYSAPSSMYLEIDTDPVSLM